MFLFCKQMYYGPHVIIATSSKKKKNSFEFEKFSAGVVLPRYQAAAKSLIKIINCAIYISNWPEYKLRNKAAQIGF